MSVVDLTERLESSVGARSSDWLGGDKVLDSIYGTNDQCFRYRELLPFLVEDFLGLYFNELRCLFAKIRPLIPANFGKGKVSNKFDFDLELEMLKKAVNTQLAEYELDDEFQSLDPMLVEDLMTFHDNLLMAMQEANLWVPATRKRDAQKKKRDYLGGRGKPGYRKKVA